MVSRDGGIIIRVAGNDDIKAAADAISVSFCDDPIFIWMLSDLTEQSERIRIAFEFFELYVTFALKVGVVHLAEIIGSGVVGATIWLPHDADDSSLGEEIERIVGPHIPRFILFSDMLNAHYPPVAPYDKLFAIATNPSIQGMGIGSALVAHRLHELDQLGIPTYLEATTRLSAGGVYERFGYQPVGEPIRFSGGVDAFPMWRNAHEQSRQSLQVYGLETTERIVRFADQNWRVLDVQKDKMLILSDKIIGKQPYHDKNESITWADCTLRHYLNETLYNSFSQEDQSRIIETCIANHNNPWFGTNGGIDTTDKIFLLCIEETVKYFGDSRQLRNKNRNTKYYINDSFNYVRKAVDTSGASVCWWLRTPGNAPFFASGVSTDGRIVVSGDFANRNTAFSGGIRPALWLQKGGR